MFHFLDSKVEDIHHAKLKVILLVNFVGQYKRNKLSS